VRLKGVFYAFFTFEISGSYDWQNFKDFRIQSRMYIKLQALLKSSDQLLPDYVRPKGLVRRSEQAGRLANCFYLT
jgi:hypothetical protein